MMSGYGAWGVLIFLKKICVAIYEFLILYYKNEDQANKPLIDPQYISS